jgi:CMP-N,N'-diacetyllegionaminic acid synthase
MLENQTVLAVVPARSGSKSLPDKNMAQLGGLSLIAWAAKILSQIPWIDRRVISTDSPRYADEARLHGLDAPFLRPAPLSSDTATALDTMTHALETCEVIDGRTYDLVIVAEPTSPLREMRDIESTVKELLRTGADTALTVSPIDTKYHPNKALQVSRGLVKFYTPQGKTITRRQELESLYSRNGLCYCFRRETLLIKKSLITENAVAVITDRPIANIDEPIDLLWAKFLLERLQKH